MKDISTAVGASSRIQKYLLDADDFVDEFCVLYRRSTQVVAKEGGDKLTSISGLGLYLVSRKEKLRFVCTQQIKEGEAFPDRTELFGIAAKEQQRAFRVRNENSIGTSINIPWDSVTGRRAETNKAGIAGVSCVEFDPYGNAVLGDALGNRQRNSRLDRAIQEWTTKWKLHEESENDGKLNSLWSSGKYGRELIFDEASGGLPVIARGFKYADVEKTRRVKGELTEVKTSWKQEEGRWTPVKTVLSETNPFYETVDILELECIAGERFEEIVRSVNWTKMYEDRRMNWFVTVSKAIADSRAKLAVP